MIQDVEYHELAGDFLKKLPQGAFLTVKDGEKVNTMTIGWGSIGYMWRRPIIMVAVRYSRYTYNLIENAGEFSVSIPRHDQFKKTLAEVGTRSGRDIDKFTEFNLPISPGKKINSPTIDQCGLIYECRTVYRQPLNPDTLSAEIKETFYRDNDYHVLFFGEILASYTNV